MSKSSSEPGRLELLLFFVLLAASIGLLVSTLTNVSLFLVTALLATFASSLVALMVLSVVRARRDGVSWLRAIGQALWGGLLLIFDLLP